MNRLLLILLFCFALSSLQAQVMPEGLQVNEVAPGFTALDQNGKKIVLKELLKDGPVVLVFYRGEWCPYCNKQLKQLEDSLRFITQKGAAVLAVSPEKQENVTKTVTKTKASYSIISDDHLKIMTAYKVSFALNKTKTVLHKLYGLDLEEKNGSNGNNLPVPAMYIIGRDGKISYRYYDRNYKKRVSVHEILSHL